MNISKEIAFLFNGPQNSSQAIAEFKANAVWQRAFDNVLEGVDEEIIDALDISLLGDRLHRGNGRDETYSRDYLKTTLELYLLGDEFERYCWDNESWK